MNTKIENLAKEYVEAFDLQQMLTYQNLILREITRDTWQFRKIEHLFLVSKVLLDILSCMEETDKKYKNVIFLTLYCLLRFISETRKKHLIEERCSEYTEASIMAFILISEHRDFVEMEILMPRFQNNAEASAYQLIGLLSVFYWIYKFSSINICLDDDLDERFNNALKESEQVTNVPDNDTQNKVENLVFDNMSTLVKDMECTFDIHDEFDLF